MNRTLPSTWLNHTHEIELDYVRPLFNKMFYIRSSKSADSFLKRFVHLKQLDLKERFWALYLNNANGVVGVSEIAKGTTTSVCVNSKHIFQLALLTNAVAIIVAHNHPSGTLKVSSADKAITKKLCSAGDLMNVKILDHLIITSESYVSLADENLM
ncbi:JAB domain-containing protein [Kordia sp.]|uniref:JAB domain-containing protein n=1 Tax=Kordia sp. TaxID=1965332 RepID=UPI003D2D8BF3